MEGKRKLVLITGVTQGIGRGMTEEFIRLGHTVLGCARSTSVIRQLRESHGGPHDFYALDVASDDEVKSWASLVTTTHGAPDILVNNAGVINLSNPLWEIQDDEFSRVVDVNIRGVANIIRNFVPPMIAQKKGLIVNMSSGWGRSVDAEVAPYCASKWAVEGLTKALAVELPSPMSAVALSPGCVNTRMLESCFGTAAHNHATPEQWASTGVPYILSISRQHNGESLTHSI